MKFLQSQRDFPLTVELGGEAPEFGLSRWGAVGTVPALSFRPPDGEGFDIRGDRRRLLYKGRKQSHRFTILHDGAFEYDCILKREPESNVIVLAMDGAEYYDFFRQPDFVRDPFLKGSYAVYKKETLIGEGTGKLCHIHRPKIIDALGRWCWGMLDVRGNELRITIPEQWLAGAKYPVVVDPTVGTTTVGSQYQLETGDPEEPYRPFTNECRISINRFLVPETINGQCAAYYYVYSYDEWDGGYPILYSDKNGIPYSLRSQDMVFLALDLDRGKPPEWRGGLLTPNASISAGNYIWYGISCHWTWYARFDYGVPYCYAYSYNGIMFPDPFPDIDAQLQEDLKLSMYFTYTSAQNHTRTLRQGVTLHDSRNLRGNYTRHLIQAVNGDTALQKIGAYYRNIFFNADNNSSLGRALTAPRRVADGVSVSDILKAVRELFRHIETAARNVTNTTKSLGIVKTVFTVAGSNDNTSRGLAFFYRLVQAVRGSDDGAYSVYWRRRFNETVAAGDSAGKVSQYVKGIFDVAGNMAEAAHYGNYRRTADDAVRVEAVSLRHVIIFVRLLTTSFVRDFIIGRFLHSNEEIVLKSAVCRELYLESTLH